MKNILLQTLFSSLLLVVFLSSPLVAQETYCVYFGDKDGVEFDPYAYFDQKAIDRRVQAGIPLDHFSDKPLRSDYVGQVTSMVDSLHLQSRWFNAVAVFANSEQMKMVEKLPFVTNFERLGENMVSASFPAKTIDPDQEFELRLARLQTEHMGMPLFQKKGIDGTGVRVAVFDVGFIGADVNSAFDHVRLRKGIIQTFDFIKKQPNVYGYGNHGTRVLSNICGIMKIGSVDSVMLGLAPGVELLLARTEYLFKEPLSEEFNWLAAAEWADKNGADIINSSLGYTKRRYFPEDLNGTTSIVTRAANMAAGKGILVVNAAGNEGDKDWRTLGCPADADSVLTVGGTSPVLGYHISFSSFGPTADKRRKPNVSAFGMAAVASKNQLISTYGTSFSSPLVTGFAACAKQAQPELSGMQLFRLIEQSGGMYPYFDYAHGYGPPQASKVLGDKNILEPTFKVEESKYQFVVWVKEDLLPEEDSYPFAFEKLNAPEKEDSVKHGYLYYHFENEQGYLSEYFVLKVERQDAAHILREDLVGVKTLRIHFRGYTYTKEL